MNKKNIGFKKGAITHGMLMVLVLFAVSLTFLVFVLYKSSDAMRSTADRTACRTSIAMNEKAHFRGMSLMPDSLACPINYLTIGAKNERAVQRAVADEMKLCWDDFKQGKAELFDESAVFCSVCSIIDFDHKEKRLNFLEYLKTTSYDEGDLSYMDYFMGYKMPTIEHIDASYLDTQQMDSIEKFTLDTSKMYSIVFVHIKGKDAFSRFKDNLGTIQTGGLLGAGAFAGTGILIGLASGLITGGVGTIVTIVSVAASYIAGVTTFIYTIFAEEDVDYASFVILKEHTASDIKDLGCEIFPSVQGDTG
jgi:hypothetical protein